LPYQQILSRSRRTVKRIGERCISAVFSVNHAALRNLYTSVYEIIMEINDLREPALDPDRPKQNRRRFLISHRLPLTPIPNCQRASAEARQ